MTSKEFLFSLAKRYPWHITINVILGFSGAIFAGISTTLVVPVVLNLLGLQSVTKGVPPILNTLLLPFESFPGDAKLYAMAVAIVLLIGLKNLSAYISGLASSSFGRAVTADLQEAGIRVLLDVDMEFFSKSKIGDLVNSLGGEMARTASTLTSVVNLLIVGITILVYVFILLSISWKLTLFSTILLLVGPIISQYWVRRSKYFGTVISKASSDLTVSLLEVLSGIRLVRATGNEEREYQRIEKFIRLREKVEFQSRVNSGAIGPINEVTNITILFLMVFVGRALFSQQIEALSTILLTYLFVLTRLIPQVSHLNSARDSLSRSSASVQVISNLLDRTNKPLMVNGTSPYTPLQQGIRFEQVSFQYSSSPDLALKQVDLFIPRGTTLALVGTSGAGKSTIADLLPRFYDPVEGRITLDGRDLRDFDIKSLRRAMGIVSQDTFLFNNTVRYNIAYHSPDVSEEAIIDAAKRANAYEFIVRLPQGFETQIGDRGVMLSGGQRQRLAIARALLQNPDLLILDEATSALDTVSERLVQEAIEELSRERTSLVIAHRLSTIQNADQIAVMERGQVVEVGTHEELLKSGGPYSRLYAIQFSSHPEPKPDTFQQQFANASYQMRAHLNAMLGSTRFLADGLSDSPQDQAELAVSAYDSALAILKTLESLEQSTQVPLS